MLPRLLTRNIDASISGSNGWCTSKLYSINTLRNRVSSSIPFSFPTLLSSSSSSSSSSSFTTASTVRGFHSSVSTYKVTSLRNEIKRNTMLNYAPLENLVKVSKNNDDNVSSSLEEKIDQARYDIFGTVKGNGQRTGRKRLRRALRGSSIKAWYGHHLNDILPENLFPIKEDYYRMEIALQRLGKSRITGKIKQPLKATVDQLTFEDALPDIIEKVDEVNYRELLLSNEIVELEQALNSVQTQEERNFIEHSYRRIALDRAQRPDAWIEYMDKVEKETTGASTPPPAEDEKGGKKRVNTFEFRQGLTDKRQWGRGGMNKSSNAQTMNKPTAATATGTEGAPTEGDKKDDSPAATTEAPGAVATAGKTESTEETSKPTTSVTTPTPSVSPSVAANPTETATVTAAPQPEAFFAPEVFHLRIFQSTGDGKSIPTSGEEFTKQYSEYIQAVATDTWNGIVKYKDSMERGVLYRDMERSLRSRGYDVSLEGLTKQLTNDTNLRHFVTNTLEDTIDKQQRNRQATVSATNEATDLRNTVRKRENTSYDRRTGGGSTGDRRKPNPRR